jgi:predicted ferric reductase
MLKRVLSEMNPFLRGMLAIALVALVVVLLSLEPTIGALFMLARIAFFLAIAFFLYLMWRERRGDIGRWSARSQWTFYGAAALIVFTLGVFFAPGVDVGGPNALILLVVIAISVFSMIRVWRDEHRYSV